MPSNPSDDEGELEVVRQERDRLRARVKMLEASIAAIGGVCAGAQAVGVHLLAVPIISAAGG